MPMRVGKGHKGRIVCSRIRWHVELPNRYQYRYQTGGHVVR
jgi:hypothetical protein